MGYTHYWNQERDFTREEWTDIRADLSAILKYAQHEAEIVLADGSGDGGTKPEITDEKIWFNGLGDDSHETMCINRVRPPKEAWQTRAGNEFCKTARKPYDRAVTAALCYLSTVTRRVDPEKGPIVGSEAVTVTSDGKGSDFLAGLELARFALPAKANMLDLPMDVMRDDRWCMPWVRAYHKNFGCGGADSGYAVHFCVDGKGYVHHMRSDTWCCFESHQALAGYLHRTKRATYAKRLVVSWNDRYKSDCGKVEPDIWNASGSFDGARHRRIARSQKKVLDELFQFDPSRERPPLFVRPGEFPEQVTGAYYFTDVLNLAGAA